MNYARNPSSIRSPIPSQSRCPSQSLKSYNRSHMQPALRSSIPDASLAVFPANGENSHQGLADRNPALYPGHEVCNFTVLLGMRGQAELNRVGPRSTGKERDTESGNDYFGARYDSSSMGRFLSPDPLGGTLANPQSLNRYAYVLNNPLRLIDPSGMSACGDDSSEGGGCVQGEDFQDSSVNGMSSLFGSSSFGSSNQGISPIAAHWEPCKDGSNSNCYVGDYDREIRCNFSAGCLQWHNNCGCWDKPTGPDPHDNMPGHDAFSLSIDEVNAQSLQGLSQDVLRAPTAPKPRVTPGPLECLLAPDASVEIADAANQSGSGGGNEPYSGENAADGTYINATAKGGPKWQAQANLQGVQVASGAALALDAVVSYGNCRTY